MSHPPQPTYGRPAYGYGAPPPQQQQPPYGGAPYTAQGNQPPDQRFYSPGPSEPQSQYPPQNNAPPPFYFVPPGQQQGGAPQPQRTPSNPNTSSDDLYASPTPGQMNANAGRPHSMAFDPRMAGAPGAPGAPVGGAQELATGSFDSPVDNRHSYMGPSQPPAQGGPTPQVQAPQGGYEQRPYSSGGRSESPYATQKPQGQQQPSDPYSDPYASQVSLPQQGNSAISSLPSQQRLPIHPGQAPPTIPGQAGGSPVYPPFGAAYSNFGPGGAPSQGGGARAPPVGGSQDESFYR
jgi:signal transducing adaptor molecule